MRTLESKLPKAGTTIFTVMTRLAEQHGAINLSQGFPDFQPPERLIELVGHHCRAGHNQYPPMTGIAKLRHAIAAKLADSYCVAFDPDTEITVTAGATEALMCAIHAVVGRDDEVIVFDPAYDSYEPAVTLAGARTVHVPLLPPDFRIDWDHFAGALSARTRLVIVNSPHNPSGAVLRPADLDRLSELTRERDCYVLSDEVYEHIIFDGRVHSTVLGHPELAERAFAVFSFGKTYHATGWKTGYCVARAPLSHEFRRVHQYVQFSAVAPIQHALADYLEENPEHCRSLPGFYAAKRDQFAAVLGPTAFRLSPTEGTYFQLADYGEISDLDDVDFARWLTIEHGVATIPISVFYDRPPAARLVRFCFAKQAETLDAAALRLAEL
jgi:methionine aminotransferase